MDLKKFPHTYVITSVIILICAVLTWIVPAGEYTRETKMVNDTERTVIVDNSFHSVDAAPQSWEVFTLLVKGFEKQAGIIAFLLIIGGAFQIINTSNAINVGILSFIRKTQQLEHHAFFRKIGVNNLVMALIMILFSLFGAVFGMSEETLAFVVILVPFAISLGYDSITGFCLVYVAAHTGFSGAMLNPFTIGIAQGLSELPLFSGYSYRLVCWMILTALLITFVLFYAARVKANPTSSLMYEADAYWRNQTTHGEDVTFESQKASRATWMIYGLIAVVSILFSVCYPSTSFQVGESAITLYILPIFTVCYLILGAIAIRHSNQMFILSLLGFTILYLIVGVMGYGWYISEIAGLFLALGIAAGFAFGMDSNALIDDFLRGAKDMLMAAIVVGLASGIIIILQEGRIIDSLLHSMAVLIGNTGKVIALYSMYALQTLINIIIPSGSAKAALTMPIMAPFSDVIGLSRQATVMAFQFGDGFTNMITPTSGVLMGALGLARIPYAVWVKWFWKMLLFLILVGALLLLPTIYMQLSGF